MPTLEDDDFDASNPWASFENGSKVKEINDADGTSIDDNKQYDFVIAVERSSFNEVVENTAKNPTVFIIEPEEDTSPAEAGL